MHSLTLRRHNSFQNQNSRKTTHNFAPRPLIFKLLQEVLKFNGICLSWRSLKTDPEMNFFKLRERQFFSIVAFN